MTVFLINQELNHNQALPGLVHVSCHLYWLHVFALIFDQDGWNTVNCRHAMCAKGCAQNCSCSLLHALHTYDATFLLSLAPLLLTNCDYCLFIQGIKLLIFLFTSKVTNYSLCIIFRTEMVTNLHHVQQGNHRSWEMIVLFVTVECSLWKG